MSSERVYLATKILAFGYWIPLIVLGFLGNFIENFFGWSVLIFWIIQLLVWAFSFRQSGLLFKVWSNKVLFYGAREIAAMMTSDSKVEGRLKYTF